MYLDVTQMRDFYYGTQLGALTQRRLTAALRELWPNIRGLTLVGYGFAAPLMRPFKNEASRAFCLMPEQQGAMRWPREGPNAVALSPESPWPLPTGFADRLLLAHAVEHAHRLDALLNEARRALAPEGRLVVIAPNRSGLWARGDDTPFGHGRPFSMDQLRALLRAHDLEPCAEKAALFAPPSHKRFWLRSGMGMERFGARFWPPRMAGVTLMEAVRRVPAMPRGKTAPARRWAPAPSGGLAAPARTRL